MRRELIQNEMALPSRQNVVEGKMRPISIATLSILERLGNPLVSLIVGVSDGSVKFTDSVENLLELFYIHSVDDEELYNIVDRLFDNPDEIKKNAIVWGCDMNINDIAKNLNELLHQQDIIQGSMVESVKKRAKGSKKA